MWSFASSLVPYILTYKCIQGTLDFFSLSIIFWKFIHDVACVSSLYCWVTFILWSYHTLFINSVVDIHLHCYQFLTIMINADMKTWVHVIWTNVKIYQGQSLWSGFYGKFLLNISDNGQTLQRWLYHFTFHY